MARTANRAMAGDSVVTGVVDLDSHRSIPNGSVLAYWYRSRTSFSPRGERVVQVFAKSDICRLDGHAARSLPRNSQRVDAFGVCARLRSDFDPGAPGRKLLVGISRCCVHRIQTSRPPMALK